MTPTMTLTEMNQNCKHIKMVQKTNEIYEILPCSEHDEKYILRTAIRTNGRKMHLGVADAKFESEVGIAHRSNASFCRTGDSTLVRQ